MAGSTDRCSDHSGSDEVGEAIIWRVERGEPRDRSTAIGHDHHFTGLHAADVLAQTVLEVADPNLRPRSSYFHEFTVATQANQSTGLEAIVPPQWDRRQRNNVTSCSPGCSATKLEATTSALCVCNAAGASNEAVEDHLDDLIYQGLQVNDPAKFADHPVLRHGRSSETAARSVTSHQQSGHSA